MPGGRFFSTHRQSKILTCQGVTKHKYIKRTICAPEAQPGLQHHLSTGRKRPKEPRTMHRAPSNTRGSRNAFKRRANKTHRLNQATPLRGGIRL